jgi:Icc protein
MHLMIMFKYKNITYACKTLLLSGIAMISTSCDTLFQYNPNEIVLSEGEKGLNKKNIASIQKIPAGDTVKFILMGDTQRWYDESADFVKSANQQNDVSFVIHAGDISDFGLSQEFKWVNEIMQELRFPYLTVIGNHDLIANGPIVYRKMYGDYNYTFEYGDNKFIFINNNSREYGFDGSTPDLNWLQQQLSDNPSGKNAIVIAHVPPFDADFDQEKSEAYRQILAQDPHAHFTLYGHQHRFIDGDLFKDGVQYYLTTSMGNRGYLLVSTWKGGHKVERINY